MVGRGMMTEEIKKKSIDFFGFEMSTAELRLYPYLDYLWKNNETPNFRRVNGEEREILSRIVDSGLVNMVTYQPTREFYNFVQDILFIAYVDLKGV